LLEVNAKNSGSPFPQWRKGVEMARGEYVWIAEADDLATPEFLSSLLSQMQAAGSVIGFCDSRTVDENGYATGDSYRPYVNQIEPGAFDYSFDMDGEEFLARYLAVKNVILNVSGVLFKREALLKAFDAVGDELYGFKVAGDWRLYVEICSQGGKVSYSDTPMNTHRRHRISVTQALKVEKHLSEIAQMHELAASKVALSEEVLQKQMQNYQDAERHLKRE
jgi:hypothetical protein